MGVKSAAALLLLAAAVVQTASAAPVPGTPSALAVGPHQILIENDLSIDPQAVGVIALLSKQTKQGAAARCSLLNEALLTPPTKASDRSAIDSQLSYLAFSQTSSTSKFWVTSANSSACEAYDSVAKAVVTTDCVTPLNGLCTSSGVLAKDTSPAPDVKTYVTVQSQDLSITGYRDARSYRFLGIPYADAPVGQLRFAPPVPYSGNKQISALKFGSVCPQGISTVGTFNLADVSEDCLSLNVWTPYLPGKQQGKLKPVAFYIYGGA